MADLINKGVGEVMRTLLEGAATPVLLVGPSSAVVEAVVETANGIDDPPSLRLLAVESTLKSVTDDFLVASNAADLVEGGVLTIRTAESVPGRELLLTDDRVTSLVLAGGSAAALSTDDEGFLEAASGYYETAWESADDYALRTPSLSRVRSTLREEIGESAADDFDDVLESLETARGDGDGLDEVTISLLVAAKNEELLYDISKWGEDVGIASKATFSRTKTTLEDLGLIDTEKVPIDVGRPRLRLKFADEALRGASADELASVARGLMA